MKTADWFFLIMMIASGLGFVVTMAHRSRASEQQSAPIKTPEFVDTTPQEITDLENRVGVKVHYDHGRQTFIECGHEYRIYWQHSPESIMEWADSLEDVVMAFDYESQEKEKQRVRAIEWDRTHESLTK